MGLKQMGKGHKLDTRKCKLQKNKELIFSRHVTGKAPGAEKTPGDTSHWLPKGCRHSGMCEPSGSVALFSSATVTRTHQINNNSASLKPGLNPPKHQNFGFSALPRVFCKWAMVTSCSSWRAHLQPRPSWAEQASKCTTSEFTNGEPRHRKINNNDT